jgi:ABC-type sugar transport system permease subunit
MSGSRRAGLLFAAPWLIGFVGLTLLPMAASAALSLTRWDGLSLRDGVAWVGLEHYREMLSGDDARLSAALSNTLFYTVVGVPLSLVTSLVFALLLNTRVAGAGVFRTIFFLPYMLSSVATVMVWSWVFNPRFGIANRVLQAVYDLLDPVVRLFHTEGTSAWMMPEWFYSPDACKPALIIMRVWLCGGAMLVFLAALQRLPGELIEAADIDGAGRWRRFLHVTLPHLSPAILFNVVMGLIFAMQSFDHAYLLFNRAQRDGLLFYMLHLYRVAFEPPYRLGYASAMAWVLFGVIAIMIVPILLVARRTVFYGGRR